MLKECLRRMTVLIALKPGVLCHDKTWGFGVIQRADDFYERVHVDFDKKSGHQMSFAYAAETLDLIGDDHLRFEGQWITISSITQVAPNRAARQRGGSA